MSDEHKENISPVPDPLAIPAVEDPSNLKSYLNSGSKDELPKESNFLMNKDMDMSRKGWESRLPGDEEIKRMFDEMLADLEQERQELEKIKGTNPRTLRKLIGGFMDRAGWRGIPPEDDQDKQSPDEQK